MVCKRACAGALPPAITERQVLDFMDRMVQCNSVELDWGAMPGMRPLLAGDEHPAGNAKLPPPRRRASGRSGAVPGEQQQPEADQGHAQVLAMIQRNDDLRKWYDRRWGEAARHPSINKDDIRALIDANVLLDGSGADWNARLGVLSIFSARRRMSRGAVDQLDDGREGQEQELEHPAVPPPPQDKAQAARDLGYGPQDQGHWNFTCTLGEGAQGHAGLWVKYDSEERIIDVSSIAR